MESNYLKLVLYRLTLRHLFGYIEPTYLKSISLALTKGNHNFIKKLKNVSLDHCKILYITKCCAKLIKSDRRSYEVIMPALASESSLKGGPSSFVQRGK